VGVNSTVATGERQFSSVASAVRGNDWRDDPREFRLAVELPEVLDSRQCDVLLGYIAEFGQERGEIGTEDGSEGGFDLSSPEDYQGGALAFPPTQFDQVSRGSALVFPSYLLHGVQPVKRGRRVALVAWVGGPRFR
jgi:hypothetical protein